MRCKSFLLFLFIAWVNAIHAQPDPKLPTILPPTPEAASITKNAELSAGLYNGAIQTSIPLTQVKMNGFTLPVTLSYSSNGTRVDEIPSREGLNWSLSAGGVITRIVNGKPDDQATLLLPTETLGGIGYHAIEYYYNLTNDESYNYDAEPDEFRIAAPGLSGKFILDTNNIPILIPYSNLKIQVTTLVTDGPYYEIIVTNTEGVKYYFGGSAVEVTTNHNIGGKLSGFTQVNTGFFLRKIELLNRDSINFYYSVLGTQNVTGVTHTVRVDKGLFYGAPCGGDQCPSGGSYFSASVADVHYNSLLLDSIKSSNNSRIVFTYENRPDNSDKRLQHVNVYEGANIKKFTLLYDDPSCEEYNHNVAGEINKRFFLRELQTVSENNSVTSDTLRHKFEYINKTALPDRLAYAQDDYGFFNGKNNQTLLPAGYGNSDYGGYAQADRKPDGNYAMIGMMNKIVYPTGGSDSIIYGKNVYTTVTATPIVISSYATAEGQGAGAATVVSYRSDSIFINREQTVHIVMEASVAVGNCTECLPPEEGVDRIVDVRIWDLTENSYIHTILYEFNYITQDYTFLANHTYQLEVRVAGDYSYGNATVGYDTSTVQHYIYTATNHDSPGIHVSKVSSFDPVTNQTNHKYYRYTSVDNLTGTSALSLYALTYNSTAYNLVSNSCGMGDWFICHSDILTSNSNAAQYFYDNNAFVYTSVIESDDPSFKNGAIEHKYAAEAFAYGTTIYGDEILQMPTNTNSWFHGAELATNYYDSSLTLVKSIDNYFHVDTAGERSRIGITIRRKYIWPLRDSVSMSVDDIAPFDIGVYTYVSSWIQQDSTVSKEYDVFGHVLTSKTTNYYGSPLNTLPVRTETLDSRGLVLKEERKYPTDSSGLAPYQRMVDKNIITPLIESKSYRNNNLIYTTKNNYHDYSASLSAGYPVIIKPQTIQVKKGTEVMETRIRFSKYDDKGNPVEMSKENDVKLAYVWDYNRDYPIAEVTNADSASIAATSFESDGKGGWTFSGSTTLHPTAPTGTKGYGLSGGNITKSGLNSEASYIVSYWKKDSASSVTVNSGSGTSLATRNGWILYSHQITGTASVTISGTAYIDELRLYPKDAMMATCTYDPMIGITSQCDVNNRIIYYEYDTFNRLRLIRDQDKNIVKTFEYKYKQQQ